MLDSSFFMNNRRRYGDAVSDNTISVFFSGSEIRKSCDVSYPFFADRNFFYLSGTESPNSVLVCRKQEAEIRWILFVERLDAQQERWFGKRPTDEDVCGCSGITDIRDVVQFRSWMDEVLEKASATICLDLPQNVIAYPTSTPERFQKKLLSKCPDILIENCHPILQHLRVIKADAEISLMREGIEITRDCFLHMMSSARPGMTELQLKAIADYTAACNGIRNMAFQPIITTGENNFCIHYSGYHATIRPGDLLLCDMGVNNQGVCCDISRCWPVDDWFAAAQEKYYRCALDVSNELFRFFCPGMPMRDVYRTQHRVLRRMLVDYKIAADEEDAKQYIWHGGAHHIGFDNHDDVYIEQYPEDPLQPNMVFAVDIGTYDVKNGIGLRIEDDCLITEHGCENLSACIPREIDELRVAMHTIRPRHLC